MAGIPVFVILEVRFSLERFISLARRRANDDDGEEEEWRTGHALLKLDWSSYPSLLEFALRGLHESSCDAGNGAGISRASRYMSPSCYRHTCYAVRNTVVTRGNSLGTGGADTRKCRCAIWYHDSWGWVAWFSSFLRLDLVFPCGFGELYEHKN